MSKVIPFMWTLIHVAKSEWFRKDAIFYGPRKDMNLFIQYSDAIGIKLIIIKKHASQPMEIKRIAEQAGESGCNVYSNEQVESIIKGLEERFHLMS